jgi:hypothetical protein
VVSGSGSVHQEIITINPAKAAEFYKLVFP